MQTPSIVSDVSAMDVASTTLRWPLRRRRDRAILHGGFQRPVERHDFDGRVQDSLAEQILGSANFRGARQKRQYRAGIGAQRHCDRIRHLPLERHIRFAAEIAGLDWKRAAFAGDHGRIAEQPGHPRAIERRRHHQNAQVFAQAGLRVARQRKSQIGVERPLVKFIKQHRGDAGQFRIFENLAREYPFGDHFNSCRARHLGAEPDTIADSLADALAQSLRHPLGAGAGRDPPRLQHDDFAAAKPRLVEQRQRHPRGLARAGRSHQYRGIVAGKRARQLGDYGVYRKRCAETAGQNLTELVVPGVMPGIHVVHSRENKT